MSSFLLTTIISELVNEKIDNQEYGVSIINLPEFDYSTFANEIVSNNNTSLKI